MNRDDFVYVHDLEKMEHYVTYTRNQNEVMVVEDESWNFEFTAPRYCDGYRDNENVYVTVERTFNWLEDTLGYRGSIKIKDFGTKPGRGNARSWWSGGEFGTLSVFLDIVNIELANAGVLWRVGDFGTRPAYIGADVDNLPHKQRRRNREEYERECAAQKSLSSE